MSGGRLSHDAVIDAMAGRELPGNVKMAALGAAGLGLLAFFGLFAMNQAWAMGALLVGIVYTMALSQAGIMYGVIMVGTEARWGRPLKRIAETMGLFMPFAVGIAIVWTGLAVFTPMSIYPWVDGNLVTGEAMGIAPHSPAAWSAKPLWLSPVFFFARVAGIGALLVALDMAFLKASLGPDLLLASKRLKESNPSWTAPSWWGWFMPSETNVEAAAKAGLHRQQVLIPLLGFGYTLGFSFLAFDLIMSLSPWWFANMFGGWFFMSSFWIGLCMIGILSVSTRGWLKTGSYVTNNVTHDLGKLILALCMFWAYTTFAQILPIWYSNMPEETDFLLVRMSLPEWQWLAKLVAITCFLAPFTILVGRGVKKMTLPFIGVCSLILVGVMLERTLLVMPSIYMDAEFPVPLFALGILVWAGFVGAFIFVVGSALAKLPPLPLSDPFLEGHPWDVHVHSLRHHGHGHEEVQPRNNQLGYMAGYLVGGLTTGFGIMGLYDSFGWVGGPLNSDFAQIGFTGIDNISRLAASDWSIVLLVVGVVTLVITNSRAWRDTVGGY
ncbi:MAG: hypothetical protein EP330_00400 [Deltaproteobacteria bacterium]|nr:MAG: hypothetical protein EP330_00400 [Deltaproteobacteria bacterium]